MVHSTPLVASNLARLCVVVLACLSVTVATSFAQGKGSKPTPAQMQQAKRHYANAKDHHEHKEYDAAATEYEKAYALFASPEFLFNVAQVYRLAGKTQLALDRYETYLELDPTGRGAADARVNIVKLKAELAEIKRREEAEAAKRAEEAKRAQESQPSEVTPDSQSSTETSTSLTTSSGGNGGGGKGMRTAGLATAGVGIVALGLGIKFGLDAKGFNDDVESNL